MECGRTNQLEDATEYFDLSKTICPHDPMVYNEIGVLHYRNQE